MGIVDSLANRLGYARKRQFVDIADYQLGGVSHKTELPDNPPAWLLNTARGEKYTLPDPEQAHGQAQLYRRLSWVQTAVSAVANFAATVPFHVKELRGGKAEDIDNHPFELLLSRPNPLQSRFEFLVEVISYRKFSGNAYIWRNQRSRGAAPSELWVLPPKQVTPIPDGKMFLAGYEYDPLDGSKPITLEPWEVVHLRTFNPDSWFVGLSPLEALAMAAKGDLAQQSWNYNLFAKNNAKIAGALAFADNIENTRWQQMQADIRDHHSGKVRNDLMMLRGVGQGAVHFLPMAMSQRDMEFLAGRRFTKEEIFSVFAPGYASIIDVNATEANAKAGQNTFREMAVWPELVALAEKLTNDLLPDYGANLVGEFEDVRIRDRVTEIAETQQYSLTHTIDEVRELAGSKPIGDERGQLLVAQITAQSGGIQEPPPMPMMQQGAEGEGDEANPEDDDAQEQEDVEEERESERKAFRRWIKKPGRDLHKFKARWLTHAELHAIAEEAVTEQPPFALTGEALTPDAVKALLLQLDPDDGEAEQKIRMAVEGKAARSLRQAFLEMYEALYPGALTFEDEAAQLAAIERMIRADSKLRDVIERMLIDSVDLGASVAVSQLEGVGYSFDWTMPNTEARDWARQYAGELVQGISRTNQNTLREATARWISNGEPLQSLVDDLAPLFGKKRAEMIAATEVTKAYQKANELAWMASGVVGEMEWITVADERVCPICGALNGEVTPLGQLFRGSYSPPAHPRCRCFTRPVLKPRGA